MPSKQRYEKKNRVKRERESRENACKWIKKWRNKNLIFCIQIN
jgi:hypothetical protein